MNELSVDVYEPHESLQFLNHGRFWPVHNCLHFAGVHLYHLAEMMFPRNVMVSVELVLQQQGENGVNMVDVVVVGGRVDQDVVYANDYVRQGMVERLCS